jgi:hypothetical protein
MLEKLIELLLHAKSGAIAAVFLIGTTGALVTATVQNGVTTITITEASPSPSASASATASPTASPSASPSASVSPSSSPSASPSSSPSSSASANPCSAEAHAAADAVKTVNSAFNGFHTDLEHSRKDAKTETLRNTLESADHLMGQIRESAVKAIHATNTCAKTDDEDKDNEQDEDKNEDSGKHSQANFILAFFQKLLGQSTTVTVVTASPTPSASPSPTVAPSATATASPASGVTFSGSDPKAIADQAVAAMKLVFDNAKAQLATATPTTGNRPFSTTRPDRTKKPESSHETERD